MVRKYKEATTCVAIERLYEYRDHDAVSEYLNDNPFLADLLIQAHDRIREHFGADKPVVLDVFDDPENGGDRELFVVIQTALPPDEALSGLDRLDQNWWLDAMRQARGKMSITVEYC